jgi:hypothetical protein
MKKRLSLKFFFRTWFSLCSDGSNLGDIFTANIGRFFTNASTVWTAAEVFNDIAEWSSLPKSAIQVLSDIIATGIVQESYQLYLNDSIGLDSFTVISSLAVTLAESPLEKLLDPLSALNSKLLETMFFLLNSDISSRTFNFWISLAEASVDIGDGHVTDPYLQQALPILLQKSSWREDVDHEEWIGYRTDVVEVFESFCEILPPEALNAVAASWLDNAANTRDGHKKIVVCTSLPTGKLTKDAGGNIIFLNFCQI